MTTDTTRPAGRNELPHRPAFTPTAEHRAHLERIRTIAAALTRSTGLNWQTEDWDGNAFVERGRFTVGIGLHPQAPDTWVIWTADDTGLILASRDVRPWGIPDERFAPIVGPVAVAMLGELVEARGPEDDGRKGVTS